MPETGDYFADLGLAPGLYSPQQLGDRLAAIRQSGPDEARLADATTAYCLLRDPERQRRYLLRLLAGPADGPAGAGDAASELPGPQGMAAVEAAFSAAVAGMLEGDSGLLRYSNRVRLLDLAGRLGIAPFEANLLIERARFRATAQPAWRLRADDPPDLPAASGTRRGRRRRWLIAAGLAILADAALLWGLFLR